MNAYELLTLKQLDKRLEPMKAFRKGAYPIQSWIQHIRTALGLSTYQLAKLMGIRQASIFTMEKREGEGHITLDTLQKAAQAMGCELVYAFVPQSSLETFVRSEEKKLADKLFVKTNTTMTLEQQGLTHEDAKTQKDVLYENIKTKPLKYLWSHSDV